MRGLNFIGILAFFCLFTLNGFCGPFGGAGGPSNQGLIKKDAISKKKRKVLICHIPSGNLEKAHTLSIDSSLINAHLFHGDYLGPCLGSGNR